MSPTFWILAAHFLALAAGPYSTRQLANAATTTQTPQAAKAPDCSRPAGSLPDPNRSAGAPDPANPIQHVVVIMQENHSFDNYFGALNDPAHYGSQVDGVNPQHANKNNDGTTVAQFKDTDLCTDDPNHDWDSAHTDWDNGLLDKFVSVNDYTDASGTHIAGGRVMGYYDQTDIPFYYAIADQFAIADRYFSSVLGPTFPNRFYLYAATSFGHIQNDMPGNNTSFAQTTIFDLLDQYNVSWKYYSDGEGYLKLFQPLYLRDYAKLQPLANYYADLKSGALPQVVFLETNFNDQGEDEHPGADVQVGQKWVSEQVLPLLQSSAWNSSALFLTYDENGGFYDHVDPAPACAPDNIPPMLGDGDYKADFTSTGFRVPFTAISPFAKHHYVSHNTYDHSSVLKFIETKFNLPALSMRDANADGLADLFDFAHPVFTVATLPAATVDTTRSCDIGATMTVPTNPVKVVSMENGLCAAMPAGLGQPLSFAACNGAANQVFSVVADGHGTFQLESGSSCAQIDWVHSQVVSASCAFNEDQGFELSLGSDGLTYQFAGWHGDFCVHDGAAGAPLAFGSCNTSDTNPESTFDFYLE